MFKKRLISLLAASCALVALGLVSVGQASAATLGQPSNLAFVAIYGNPGSNGATLPVGGGLARNFGFGENMLFRASTTAEVGKNLKFKLAGEVAEARDSYLGATLMANKTGVNHPLDFAIQFADFQDSTIGTAATPTYADTYDRPWITFVCSAVAETKCKTDAQFAPTGAGGVEIENVSINLGPGLVLQGTVWGKWKDGAAKKCPSITLEKAPAATDPTLVVTQDTANEAAVGTAVEEVGGEACLISANNDWYKFSTVENTPAITIKNE